MNPFAYRSAFPGKPKNYGIDAETGEIKSINTSADLLKDTVRRLASKFVWAVKVAFRFKVR